MAKHLVGQPANPFAEASIVTSASPLRQLLKTLKVDEIIQAIRCARCLLCDGPCTQWALCAGCLADLPWMTTPCPHCGLPGQDENAVCAGDHDPEAPDGLQVLWAYAFPVSVLMGLLKREADAAVIDLLAGLMADRCDPSFCPEGVLGVPSSPVRLRTRGFDHTALLVRALCRRRGWPLLTSMLTRPRETAAQKTLHRAERQENLRGAFQWTGPALNGAHLLIVDDVVTTGATLREVSRTLRAAGAGRLDALAVARTLPS